MRQISTRHTIHRNHIERGDHQGEIVFNFGCEVALRYRPLLRPGDCLEWRILIGSVPVLKSFDENRLDCHSEEGSGCEIPPLETDIRASHVCSLHHLSQLHHSGCSAHS